MKQIFEQSAFVQIQLFEQQEVVRRKPVAATEVAGKWDE